MSHVAQRAAEVLSDLSGEDLRAVATVHSRSTVATPGFAKILEAQKSKVTLLTTQGEIVLEMADSAPLTAVRFVALARQGAFNGRFFYRIVPDFVAQGVGTDPLGSDWSGLGELIRDEISMVPHAAGTVGIATAGKDTGDNQFFINFNNNSRLVGAYTVFARVTSGLDVARRLTPEDKIVTVSVQSK